MEKSSKNTSGLEKILVLVACYNRKKKTIACLKSIKKQDKIYKKIRILLFDDGSTDGTTQIVKVSKLADKIFLGNGEYYWCGAMRYLIDKCYEETADFILMINDDTIFKKNAFKILLETYEYGQNIEAGDCIVVGAIKSRKHGNTTYSGLVRKEKLHPFRFVKMDPTENPQMCETFNANCVFIPQKLLKELGGLSNTFTHGLGDIDLGLRATKRGIRIWLTRGYVGYCEKNKLIPKAKTLLQRWKYINTPKGVPPYEHYVFCKSHVKILWPFVWISRMVKDLLPPK
jgi:GT2 family glycosyltransferase